MKCICCGCTEKRACVGGCSWASVDPPVCDRCDGGEPFVTHRDPTGQWEVVGPGPYGAKRVMVVVASSDLDAGHTAELLNQAYKVGARAGARITSRLAVKKINRDLGRDALRPLFSPPAGGGP